MKLFIISGLSGSGKSTVLHVLEDIGFFCIDNLPISLLSNFAAQMVSTPERFYEYAAVGIDARNRSEDLKRFSAILSGLRTTNLSCEVVFLDADDDILIKRFSETRRKHPLTKNNVSLAEAIQQERELLDPISHEADLYLETSRTNLHQLRDLIKERLTKSSDKTLSLLFMSFGFKHGLPADADFIFDVRSLPNPYWETHLREYTGKDQPVIEFLEKHNDVTEMHDDIKNFAIKWIPRIKSADRTYLTIAIGCTGGHHRSVYLIEKLSQYFKDQYDLIVRHRELE
ncbi:MAG: RNase adapter RapZ [Gammaproteobacteria bacterium]|nr:RNase adapter RapZ [Gammaproteobacteria bacterium]